MVLALALAAPEVEQARRRRWEQHLSGERQPLGGAPLFVVVFAVTLLSSVLLRGTGLDWWQRLGVQLVVVAAAVLAWSRWRTRR